MPKADEKILSYNDVVLRQSDLGILNGPYYLNDRIIEFYLSYLSSFHPSDEILLVPPSISFWTTNCPDVDTLKDFLRPLNLPSRKLIVFPVNNNEDMSRAEGGSHWSLLAFERDANVFVHHDSFGGLNGGHARRLYEAVVAYVGVGVGGSDDAGYVECPCSPQQVNGYDCGLYVLAAAEVLCRWFVGGEGRGRGDQGLWFARVTERVTPSAVLRLRKEVLELIERLRGKR